MDITTLKAALLRSPIFLCFAHYQTSLSELRIKKAEQMFGFWLVAGAGLTRRARWAVVGGITTLKAALLRSPIFLCFAHYQTSLSELRIKKAEQMFGFWLVAGAGLEPATFGL